MFTLRNDNVCYKPDKLRLIKRKKLFDYFRSKSEYRNFLLNNLNIPLDKLGIALDNEGVLLDKFNICQITMFNPSITAKAIRQLIRR